MALHTLALFAGGCGIELGLKTLFGDDIRTVCYVERESYAAAVIVARMEDKTLDQAPVWASIETFDGRPWRGKVDLITGGFPCTDLSVAGKQAGIDGEHSGLWSEYARIIGEVRPEFVFIENVPGLLANEPARRVLGDLSTLLYDAEGGSFRASDVGAPHKRERVFILGHAKRDRRAEGRSKSERQQRRGEVVVPQRQKGTGGARSTVETMGHAQNTNGRPEQQTQGTRIGRGRPAGAGEDVAHAAKSGLQRGDNESAAPVAECSGSGSVCPPLFPPGPDDAEGWARLLATDPSLAPAIDKEVEFQIRRNFNVLAYRMDRLRLTGNGVVSLVAAYAFATLADRLTFRPQTDEDNYYE